MALLAYEQVVIDGLLIGAKVFGDGLMGSTCIGPVSVAGPLCRSVRDVQLILRLVSQAQPWVRNPFLLPSPWLAIGLLDRPLRIGVWTSHDHVHLLPPVARGLALAQSRLKGSGCRVSSFNGPSISRVWDLQKEWVEVQGLEVLRQLTMGEPMTDIVRATNILHPVIAPPALDLRRLHGLNAEISRLASTMAKAWITDDGQSLDALLWVPAPHTAIPFDQYTDLSFTAMFNVIDWPAIALPLGESVSATEGDTDPMRQLSTPMLFGQEDKRVQEMFYSNLEKFEGLPLSVQLIGRRGEDERLLSVAERIHGVIRTS